MKYLKQKVTGVLFPYNPEHAERDYFETVEVPYPAPENEDDSQDNEQQFFDAKPKRVYRRRSTKVADMEAVIANLEGKINDHSAAIGSGTPEG